MRARTWRELPFDAVLADVGGGNVRSPTSEFRDARQYAIVDQGQKLVAGYTDDAARVCRTELPAIVFGDHTCAFKFVDFPFCIGADGVKVLRPRIPCDLKYLYHFLRSISLPDTGYDRHFKYLRRVEIPVPPLAEQRRIAAILDQAEALRAKRRGALERVEQLSASTFRERFGPASNQVLPLAECAEVVSGVAKGRKLPASRAVEVPYLRVANVQAGYLDLSEIKTIEALPEEVADLALRVGDVVLTEGGDFDKLGRGALWSGGIDNCIHQNHVFRVRLDQRVLLPVFFAEFLQSSAARAYFLKCAKRTTNLASINMTQLRALPTWIPPIEHQRQFGAQVAAIDRLKAAHRASLAKLDQLFASLQHRAFRGEL